MCYTRILYAVAGYLIFSLPLRGRTGRHLGTAAYLPQEIIINFVDGACRPPITFIPHYLRCFLRRSNGDTKKTTVMNRRSGCDDSITRKGVGLSDELAAATT